MHNNEQHNQGGQMHTRISVMVLQKIETQKSEPTPKAYFVLRNIFMWSLASFSIIFGAFSISGIIFRISNFTRVLPPSAQTHELLEAIAVLPFFWILAFSAFAYLAYLEVRNTRQGYRYHLSTLLLSMVVVSGVLGIALYHVGSGFIVDRFASRYVPFNPDIEKLQRSSWFNPAGGLLAGVVLDIDDNRRLVIEDSDEMEWEVIFPEDFFTEDRFGLEIEEGQLVGIQGTAVTVEGRVFTACGIRVLGLQGRGWSERKIPAPRTNLCEGVRPRTQ